MKPLLITQAGHTGSQEAAKQAGGDTAGRSTRQEVPDGDVHHHSLCNRPVELNIRVLASSEKERNGSAQAALCRSVVLGGLPSILEVT